MLVKSSLLTNLSGQSALGKLPPLPRPRKPTQIFAPTSLRLYPRPSQRTPELFMAAASRQRTARSWVCATQHILANYQGAESFAGAATQTDVDGFLVGGASLKPEFVDIVNARKAKAKA